MRKLENLTNVEAPSIDFPYGDLKNNTGSNNGTPVNRALLSDVLQFAQKLADEAGIVQNDLDDNETNGWQLYEAFRKLTKPYKSYVARHIQSSTDAPTTTPVGFNDIGNIVWSRSGTGEYIGTLTGAFIESKTIILSENGSASINTGGSIRRVSDNEVQLRTFSAGSPSDGVSSFCFEIRVYD